MGGIFIRNIKGIQKIEIILVQSETDKRLNKNSRPYRSQENDNNSSSSSVLVIIILVHYSIIFKLQVNLQS